jgi:hypothetical protein
MPNFEEEIHAVTFEADKTKALGVPLRSVLI